MCVCVVDIVLRSLRYNTESLQRVRVTQRVFRYVKVFTACNYINGPIARPRSASAKHLDTRHFTALPGVLAGSARSVPVQNRGRLLAAFSRTSHPKDGFSLGDERLSKKLKDIHTYIHNS